MECPKGVEEIFEVIKHGLQVHDPPETFAIAVSILPPSLIEYLIGLGANVNSSFQDGESAIHAAIRVNSRNKFRQIVRNNGSLTREWRGLTPIDTAIVYYLSGNITPEIMNILENESNDHLIDIAWYMSLHFNMFLL